MKDALRCHARDHEKLALVQFCTWFGLFCMWIYFPVVVARNVFGAPTSPARRSSPRASSGRGWLRGSSTSAPSASPSRCPESRRGSAAATHSLCLGAGALALLGVPFVHDKWLLLLPMLGMGMAWASILSMPYAILAGALPAERTGTYMGIFNFFIVIPEIVAATGFG